MSEMNQLAENYKNGSIRLDHLIVGLTSERFDFIPAHDDAWSIKEHIIHIVDSEVNGFVRLKSIIAQPGSHCYVMEEDGWTRNLRRKNENVHAYLDLFKLIRKMALDFILEEPEATWNDQYFIRTYKGQIVQVTIEKWLELYTKHLDFHVEYIMKIVDEIQSVPSR